jgi:hypothetical protein
MYFRISHRGASSAAFCGQLPRLCWQSGAVESFSSFFSQDIVVSKANTTAFSGGFLLVSKLPKIHHFLIVSNMLGWG